MSGDSLTSADADAWARLRRHTPARIGLRLYGAGLATEELLSFQLAHARARDAVHVALDMAALTAAMGERAWPAVHVRSAAKDRRTYLLRPDLGRQLDPESAAVLPPPAEKCDLVIVVADGLSAVAVQRHAVPLLDLVIPALQHESWSIAPIAIAEQARVAMGDDIGARVGARLVMVLIGERPGLSAPDSLGVYLTWNPAVGRTDAERNCISNIRPEGLNYPEAAAKVLYLLMEARRRSLTGIMLKDETAAALIDQTPPAR